MGTLLNVIAVIMIILWAVGYYAYGAGPFIHSLLVIAVIAMLLRVIQGIRSSKE
ncbi:MAG: lmo0937 family membrane protein [Bacteroidota bacterium]